MFVGDLIAGGCGGDGEMQVEHSASGEAAAFKVVPAANHFCGDAEIFGNGFDGIASADFVVSRRVRVGAGVNLLSRSDGNNQTRFGSDGVVVESFIEVVGFGDGAWRRVISARDSGEGFAILHLVITPPDALVGGNGGDGHLELVGGSRGQDADRMSAFLAESLGVVIRSRLGFRSDKSSAVASTHSATKRRSMG